MLNKCVYNPKKHHDDQQKHINSIKKSSVKNSRRKSLMKENIKKSSIKNSSKKSLMKDNSKKQLIKLENKDYLIKFGYSTKLSKNNRHKILLMAVSEYGYSSVIHRLVALRTLTKNTQPKKSSKYNNDIIELQKWKKYMEHIGGNSNINKIIKNILNIEKKIKKIKKS
jgi:hypothetical protein